MKFRLLACAIAATCIHTSVSVFAQAPKGGSVAFILDCSRSMGEPAEASALVRQVSDGEESTRMDLAQSLLRKMLRDLAAGGTSRAGLWLYGHRLVWESDVKHPDLVPQDDYLEATVGYGALNGLLPGDDVEQAEPIKPFKAQDCERFVARLNVVKPWGEKPLYLAITRALEALADQPAAAPKNIVVITDGGNEQWLARFKTTHERTGGAIEHNIVPIHFLHVGPQSESTEASEQELRDLAEQGGGSFQHVALGAEIKIAQLLTSSRKVQPVTAADDEPDTVEGRIAQAKAVLARPVDRTISGSVVYFGKPVPSATVTLEGTDISPVKADRQGRFLIRKVPSGHRYHVVVKGVALNSFREKALDLTLDADSEEQPFLTIDLK